MTETARIDIASTPEEVWALVGQFGGLDSWMAGVDRCEVDGDIRTVETMGMTITEKLIGRDDDARTITYAIVGEGAPAESHEATIGVAPNASGGSEVTWSVTVEPTEAEAMFRDIYQGALANLKQHLEG